MGKSNGLLLLQLGTAQFGRNRKHASNGAKGTRAFIFEPWKLGSRPPLMEAGHPEGFTYAANTDIKELAAKRLQQGIEKRLTAVKSKLKTIRETSRSSALRRDPKGAYAVKRLEEIESLLQQAEGSGFVLHPQIIKSKAASIMYKIFSLYWRALAGYRRKLP